MQSEEEEETSYFNKVQCMAIRGNKIGKILLV